MSSPFISCAQSSEKKNTTVDINTTKQQTYFYSTIIISVEASINILIIMYSIKLTASESNQRFVLYNEGMDWDGSLQETEIVTEDSDSYCFGNNSVTARSPESSEQVFGEVMELQQEQEEEQQQRQQQQHEYWSTPWDYLETSLYDSSFPSILDYYFIIPDNKTSTKLLAEELESDYSSFQIMNDNFQEEPSPKAPGLAMRGPSSQSEAEPSKVKTETKLSNSICQYDVFNNCPIHGLEYSVYRELDSNNPYLLQSPSLNIWFSSHNTLPLLSELYPLSPISDDPENYFQSAPQYQSRNTTKHCEAALNILDDKNDDVGFAHMSSGLRPDDPDKARTSSHDFGKAESMRAEPARRGEATIRTSRGNVRTMWAEPTRRGEATMLHETNHDFGKTAHDFGFAENMFRFVNYEMTSSGQSPDDSSARFENDSFWTKSGSLVAFENCFSNIQRQKESTSGHAKNTDFGDLSVCKLQKYKSSWIDDSNYNGQLLTKSFGHVDYAMESMNGSSKFTVSPLKVENPKGSTKKLHLNSKFLSNKTCRLE
jgi:hypothetical protein